MERVRARALGLWASEGVPGWFGGELEVADVDAEPGPEPGADGHDHHLVLGGRRQAEAAHQIGRAVEADEAGVERLDRGQVVDQHHGARPVPADVEAERGACQNTRRWPALRV